MPNPSRVSGTTGGGHARPGARRFSMCFTAAWRKHHYRTNESASQLVEEPPCKSLACSMDVGYYRDRRGVITVSASGACHAFETITRAVKTKLRTGSVPRIGPRGGPADFWDSLAIEDSHAHTYKWSSEGHVAWLLAHIQGHVRLIAFCFRRRNISDGTCF